MRRHPVRALVAAVAAIAALAIQAPGPGMAQASCGADALLVPKCAGAWWGAYPDAFPNDPTGQARATPTDYHNALQDLQTRAGRKFAIVHRYTLWQENFPDAQLEKDSQADGSHLFFCWQTDTDQTSTVGRRWDQVAAGAYDADILRVAGNLQRYSQRTGKKVFMDIDCEPEARMDPGNTQGAKPGLPAMTDANFVAAFRHIHQVFDGAGVTSVVWVWTTMGWMVKNPATGGWEGRPGGYQSLYPGDRYVDWIMWDPYNKGYDDCNGGPTTASIWTWPAGAFSQFYNFLNEPAQTAWHGPKPYGLAEYGSVESRTDPLAKQKWLEQVPGALQGLPNIRAVNYFNKSYNPPSTVCTRFAIDTSSNATNGFRNAGASRYVNP